MKASGLLVFSVVAALSIGCNGRHRTDNTIAHDTTDTAGTAGSISSGDKTFVNDQLSGGMVEVQLAQLAKAHASNPDVKQFAQMMIDDHTQAGDQLKQVASTNAIPQQPQIDRTHQNLMDRLSKMNGSDFDKSYMDAMVDDHEKDVSRVRARVDEARRPKISDDLVTMAVNQWAADTLPTIAHHLERAKQIKDDLSYSKRTE